MMKYNAKESNILVLNLSQAKLISITFCLTKISIMITFLRTNIIFIKLGKVCIKVSKTKINR